MKKFLKYLLVLLLLLTVVLMANTFRFRSTQETVQVIEVPALPDSSLRHFQEALRFKTISFSPNIPPDSAEFTGFRRYLETVYPLVHQKLTRDLVNYTIVLKWSGKQPTLKPVILLAHQDVVPIEPATKDMWEVDPFAGVVKDGFIWGRGTTDDKISLIAIMESVEKLLSQGFQPERTIYFVFGHDEEVTGKNGALQVAMQMEKQGLKAEFILDEGGIVSEKVAGVGQPVALLATAEKGYLTVELTVNIQGGHSSYPAEETAIDVLSTALVKIRKNQMPQRMTEPVSDFFDNIGPEMPFGKKVVFANRWLFDPLLKKMFARTDPKAAAMLRTTTVPTIVQSGIKENVIPTVAKATVNFRILQGDTSDGVLEHLKKSIGDDRVVITPVGSISEPSPITNAQCFGYKLLSKVAKQNFDNAIASPFVLIGATDSRHFTKISDNIVKFNPMIDPIGFHGINERVSLESYRKALSFYESLFRSI